MISEGATTTAAAAVLERAQRFRRSADMAEAHLLGEVLAWCELHVTHDPDDAAAWPETWRDSPVRLGGEGCPWVREFTTDELAGALHLSPAAARSLVADVLELAFRLPRLWEQVQSGAVPAWRARRIAAKTQVLSMEAAGYVDAHVAGFAHRVGVIAVEHLVDEATGRFMPELARRQREQSADQRRFDVHHDQVAFAGTSLVEAELDLADAVDLDAAIAQIAAELKDLGNDLPLDQRRALAAGELARRHLGRTNDTDVETAKPRARRDMTVYAHLAADAVAGVASARGHESVGEAVVMIEGHGEHLVTLDALREWLQVSGEVKVSVRPVIDLNADIVSSGRFRTTAQHEQLTLRDKTCAAPYCERPARGLDVDHIQPWGDGPPGMISTGSTTESSNLAALCRHHHRAKTLTAWTYQALIPGVFLWISPHHHRFLTFAGQTIDLEQCAAAPSAA